MRSLVALSLAVSLGTMAVAQAAPSDEAPFLAENRAAMDKMMKGMNIQPSGNVDRDFAAMMIPHHQGAVDMAEAELRNGHNEQLRRIARQIIAAQPPEIASMRQALRQMPALPSVASIKQPTAPMMNMQLSR